MPIGRLTIRQWMDRYNGLVRIARSRGITRGPDGALLHELTNLRVSNEAARGRVLALEAHIGGPITISRETVVAVERPPVTQQRSRGVRPPSVANRLRQMVSASTETAAPPAVRSSTPTFGVEIECLFPSRLSMGSIAQALVAAGIPTEAEMYNHSRRGHWKIVTDGSLHPNPNTTAYEIVSPVLSGQTGLEQIAKVCTALHSLGAVVNRSCGLHVHVGVSNELDNANFFRRLVRLYKEHAPHIERVLSPSRRQNAGNFYCRDFRAFTNEQLERCSTVPAVINLANGDNPRGDRYFKLNLNAYFRHRTVEFRQHQGTIDAQKATMWTRFCLKLVAAAGKTATLMASTDLAGLLDQIEASEDEKTYFLARQAHFTSLEDSGDI